MSQIGENYERLLERIGEAALRVGRDPASIRLVGVTKRVDVARIQEAIDSGLSDIGENRVQEAEEKIPLLQRRQGLHGTAVRTHFIGHLQANKVKKAVGLFSCIQSVDSISLAQRLDHLAPERLSVLIQVKLGDEDSKTGILESELPQLIDAIQRSENLDLRGLMTIPLFIETVEELRPYFRRLRQKAHEFALPELSMGMSHDFEIAIEEGATIIRVGTALFGDRG
jgi:pyridoxal phosphate enzyme (YggS family)